ncbi:3342_t:CDS:2 [Paraglomus brasilianum]|uniref:3342_t:CDS:1 n=1 Tax=Paraglomus brasilianum TaxID=144538 RepID=A0A9N9FPK5_9GLOM|nr:3342_t:CDS:2 [Paraglomus brasilianum]
MSSTYTKSNDTQEVERLNLQHTFIKHGFNGNFAAPVDQILRSGVRVLDVGCGSGTWILELAEEYPNSHFVGVDMSPVVLRNKQPDNVEFITHNVLTGLPFEDNSFDYVFARLLSGGYTRRQWKEIAIPEYTRVTKPTGWVELMEGNIQLKYNSKDNFKDVDLIIKAVIDLLNATDVHSEAAYEIKGFLEEDNRYNNINYKEKHLPVGPMGEKLAEMGIEDCQEIWKLFKPAVVPLLQVSEEEYNAIYESAIQYLKTFGAKWVFARAWGQKV